MTYNVFGGTLNLAQLNTGGHIYTLHADNAAHSIIAPLPIRYGGINQCWNPSIRPSVGPSIPCP